MIQKSAASAAVAATIVSVVALLADGALASEPLRLNDAQMDTITAGMVSVESYSHSFSIGEGSSGSIVSVAVTRDGSTIINREVSVSWRDEQGAPRAARLEDIVQAYSVILWGGHHVAPPWLAPEDAAELQGLAAELRSQASAWAADVGHDLRDRLAELRNQVEIGSALQSIGLQ